MTYPFPDDVRNPDREGPNPFAEDHVDESAEGAGGTAGDSPLGSTEAATEYQPEYEAVTSNRSRIVFILGVLGLALSLSGWGAYAGEGMLILMPVASLAFSITAAFMGTSERGHIKAGRKTSQGAFLIVIGTICGMLGILNTVVYTVVGILVTDLLRL